MLLRSNTIFFLALSLTLFFGVGLYAQELPDYGIRRLQTAPELPFGTFPAQVVATNNNLVIQGTGWDSINVHTNGAYFSVFDGSGLETIFFDSLRIRSRNDFERASATPVPNGLLSIRNANYDPIDTNYITSGAASILEFVSFATSQTKVFQIDTLWIPPAVAEEQSAFLTTAVRNLDVSRTDTIRYVFNSGFTSNRQAIVEVRSYVPDPILGYRKVETTPITNNIEPNDWQVGVWSFGDTLGRAKLVVEQGGVNLYVRYFDIHTGDPLGSRLLVKTNVNGLARVVSNVISGLGHVTEGVIDFDAPPSRSVITKVWTFDLHIGELQWEKEYFSKQDWFINPFWETTRVDSSGQTILTAYASNRLYDSSAGKREAQIELKAANAVTGDSLWATYLRLDSFTTRNHSVVPRDIAMKPNGEGYIVAAWVSETKLDPNRDLRYAYTALFFLDSLGCLAPGCREISSTKDASLGYEISLAPNPVRSGGELSVSFPESVSEVRYAITNGQGQRLGFSGSESVLGGKLDVQIDDLPSGMYYLTVWPSGSGNAMLTRGFVVE
jgi:hypothetical protein